MKMADFNGLGMSVGALPRLSHAVTRSISAENPSGEKGSGGMATEGTGARCARDLGQGWKVSPSVLIKAGQTFTLADIGGPGALQHLWITGDLARKGPLARHYILRIYWDGQEQPSIECPAGDFFASGWGPFAQINSLPVVVNPNRGFNCYWEMPFRERCRVTLENRHHEDIVCYYQIDYTLTDVPDDLAYFHAQFRRTNPLPYKQPYTIVDGIRGFGHYVGTSMAWGVNNNGWWGEGEIKFYLDGDGDFPTTCGTGTEDYFGGAWGFGDTFSTAYLGYPLWRREPGEVPKHCLYRWHVMDPIRFEQDLRVSIQALGWWPNGKFQPLADDIASVATWYQSEPHVPFPAMPPVHQRWPR